MTAEQPSVEALVERVRRWPEEETDREEFDAALDSLTAALTEKPDQPILNACRRLLLATDNAERNARLGDLWNVLEPERSAALERAERERDEQAERLTAYETPGWINSVQKVMEERRRAEAAEARAQKAEAVVEAARNFDARFEERFIDGMAKPLNDALTAYDEPPTGDAEPLPPDPRLIKRLNSDGAPVDEPPTEQIPGAGQDGC